MAKSIKSNRVPHSWKTTGGYDRKLDGDNPAYGRIEVTCETCGEKRRIGCSIDDFLIRYGCIRNDFTGRYSEDDYVVVGGRLDTFVGYLRGDMCVTRNAGGGSYTQHVRELTPVLVEKDGSGQ